MPLSGRCALQADQNKSGERGDKGYRRYYTWRVAAKQNGFDDMRIDYISNHQQCQASYEYNCDRKREVGSCPYHPRASNSMDRQQR